MPRRDGQHQQQQEGGGVCPSAPPSSPRGNLRAAMLARKMDATELGKLAAARQSGHTVRMTARHLSGETRMPLDTVALYARILGVDPGWLAFGEGPPR